MLLRVKDAAVRLGLPAEVVRILMEQKTIDIGYVIRNQSRNTYVVIPELLEREVQRRAGS